ncbi:MAG: GGDEF domain-containing protein [Campylobacter sp.]
MNIFSVSAYAFCMYFMKKNMNNLSYIFIATRIEIFAHAFICAYVLGWDYGFQNIILAFASMVFFNSLTKRYINYTFSLIEFLALLCLLTNEKNYPIDDVFTVEVLHLVNFGAIVFLVVFMMFDFMKSLDKQQYQNVAVLNETLSQKANKDPLTGISNRNCFYNTFLANSSFSKKYVSVAICDIDNFKKINDTFGHAFGDEVLIRIADVLQSNSKSTGYTFRWGGEEFLLIFLDTTLKNSYAIVDDIRKKISDLAFFFEEKEIKVTMTFGLVNVLVYRNTDINLVIKKADELLYEGKTSGKNCVVSGLVITN